MTVQKKKPKVSIGIPIYFGEVYLEETLLSILKQSFQDYEIIIADNNPGGEPEIIALKYAAQDKRITYIRHEVNRGALQNWNSLIHFAKGEYFIYAGGHDLWSENLLAALVQILENSHQVVNAYSPSFLFKDEIEHIIKSTGFVDTSNSGIIARVNQILWAGQDSLYGLIRISAIKKTRLQLEIIGSGAVWLSELSLYGDFRVCLNEKRYRRINRSEFGREKRLERYHTTLFSKHRLRLLPFWRIPIAYLTIPITTNFSFFRRVRIRINLFIGSILKYGNDLLLDMLFLLKRLMMGKLIKWRN